jgi:hypothetical protein
MIIGVPRDVRRGGYKELLHRGLYTIFLTTIICLNSKFPPPVEL